MLSTLRIRNLALCEDVTLEPGPGLNLITGETGAGKSLLVGALQLLLGERADRQIIRSGAESCSVDAVFHVGAVDAVARLLAEEGIDPCEEGELIVRRVVQVGGASRSFVNGSPARLQLLRGLGEILVDMHGPHDHQSLLRQEVQRQILDDYGGLTDGVRRFGEVHQRWRDALRRQDELERAEGASDEERELARFQLAEIEQAELTPGEGERLREEHRRCAHAARIQELAGRCALLLATGEEGTLFDRLAEVRRMLDELVGLDGAAAPFLGALEPIQSSVRDLAASLAERAERAELDPARQRELEERMALIHRIARKYGGSEEEALGCAAELRAKLDRWAGAEARRAELAREIAALAAELGERELELRESRAAAARRLGDAVRARLASLGFAQAGFAVSLEPGERTAAGSDRVDFLLCPNPGEELRPLRLVASSGEASRVMLAIKTALAAQDRVPLLVFDEVDANVGGELAVRVGEHLRELARSHQIVCITHLPQVAARAEQHFRVEKDIAGGRTSVRVERVEGPRRVEELARMLGGGPAALQHARGLVAARDQKGGPVLGRRAER